MSTTSKSFLDEMREIGDEFGKQGGGAGFVTQIKIEFGFYAFGGVEHDRVKFWKPCPNKKEAPVIKAEVQARLDEAGVKEEADWCMRVFADKDNVGRDPFQFDTNAFYPRWQWDVKKDGIDTCASLIFANIEENKLPFGELFWGQYQLKSNPYHVAKGEDGKKLNEKDGKMYWPNFALPVAKFGSEAEAQAAAGGDDQSASVAWSTTARESYVNLEDISKNQILEWYTKARDGIAYNNDAEHFPLPPKPMPATPVNIAAHEEALKEYIGQLYQLEPSDIDYIVATTTPF